MPEWLKYLIVFMGGLLFTYVFQFLDMTVNHFANKQTFKVSKMQVEIDKLSEGQEAPILEPAIGFRCESEEEYCED